MDLIYKMAPCDQFETDEVEVSVGLFWIESGHREQVVTERRIRRVDDGEGR